MAAASAAVNASSRRCESARVDESAYRRHCFIDRALHILPVPWRHLVGHVVRRLGAASCASTKYVAHLISAVQARFTSC